MSWGALINLIYCQLEFFVTALVLEIKIMKTLKENTAAFLQTRIFLLSLHAVVQFLGCLSCSVLSARQQAAQEIGISLLCFCLFTPLCFLFCCSLVGFITSHSPFRVVTPLSLLSASAQADLPLVFLLLSCLSVSLVLAWAFPFSSSCCSTVMSFSWHLQPCLRSSNWNS